MRYLLFLGSFIIPFLVNAQHKHDYNWLIGVEYADDPNYPINCMNLLSFQGGELSIEKLSVDYPMYVANASISNSEGKLLFHTNGCDVKNANHEIMPNGSGLNPGVIYEDNCPDGGYTSTGGVLVLLKPNDLNEYYVFHQAFEIFNESPFVRINRLYYSVVNMQEDNGLGDVLLKNQVLLKNIQHMGIQAVRHANNQDWWVFALNRFNNEYYRILLTADGIVEIDSQAIGEIIGVPGGGRWCFHQMAPSSPSTTLGTS